MTEAQALNLYSGFRCSASSQALTVYKNKFEKIAIGKIICVEKSIDLCFRLKQEVGSYALMNDTGFEHMDFL